MKLIKKNREVISYLIFGVLTTLVNYLCYYLAKDFFSLDYRLSNFIAWFFSVLFAFITNKHLVFLSESKGTDLLKEAGKFYFYRILSLVIDMGAMIVLISGLHLNDFLAKTITQVLVIVLNYVFSKWFIFKGGKN